MAPDPRHEQLEVDQDLSFQRREWRVQRIGRFALLGIIIASIVGVFGSGPLSSATARTSDGRLEISYHRMARHGSPEPLEVRVTAPAPTDSIVDIWIDQSYLHGLAVRWISPEPVRVTAGGDRLTYRFQIGASSRAANIVFQVDAEKLWMRRGAIGLASGDSIIFRQFVFP